jgi:hypothetical protein
MANITQSDLTFNFKFKAEPTEHITIGDVSHVIEWVDFTLTCSAEYNGETYTVDDVGCWKLDPDENIEMFYDGDEEGIAAFKSSFIPMNSVTSEDIAGWLGWNDSGMVEKRKVLKDALVSLINTEEEEDTDTLTFE